MYLGTRYIIYKKHTWLNALGDCKKTIQGKQQMVGMDRSVNSAKGD